eukprot:scaffold289290_cov25-Prasinocladus_malaysianus.AAC.2
MGHTDRTDLSKGRMIARLHRPIYQSVKAAAAAMRVSQSQSVPSEATSFTAQAEHDCTSLN